MNSLQERTKELNCLYEVEALCNHEDYDAEEVCRRVCRVLPEGWQYPDICQAEIVFEGDVFRSPGYIPSTAVLSVPITVQDRQVGTVSVSYREDRPDADEGPFLIEEKRLIHTVAERIAHFMLFKMLGEIREEWREARLNNGPGRNYMWSAPLQMLRDSDRQLYLRIARKFLNHLSLAGVAEAQAILARVDSTDSEVDLVSADINIPGQRFEPDETALMSDAPFELASRHMGDKEILRRVQQWMQEDRAGFFLKVLDNPRSSLHEIADALRRYHHMASDKGMLPRSTRDGLRVSLIRRFLTEQLDYIKVAKNFFRISDFTDLLDRMVLPVESHGRLGGKGSGLLLAEHILERCSAGGRSVGEVKVPRTWYVASDALLDFIAHNDLEDALEQKYKDIEQVRQEYPNIIQLFKNSAFPPELIKGLSLALDELGEKPLIVRSSSLLEDRFSTAFSGKYKSLFLANRGTKQERLEALLDAIAEIYASVVGPDPIEYRRERGLLDFNEEMGLLIQEVVGVRVGRYFMPAFAGVAFSRNEFRWSSRIEREDGLLRLVPGLGTRAVDRTSDDYPTLVVPGKPNLRVNVAIDEIVRYAPKKVDAINLEKNTFETVELADLVREYGSEIPGFTSVFSELDGEILKKPVPMLMDRKAGEFVVTFDSLFRDTPFLKQFANILSLLEENLGSPVDVEFVHDGKDFYLVQCRPQSYAADETPAPIPKDAHRDNILFTARRYVSNGWLPEITHLVYVDPGRYGELADRASLLAIGRAVGKLNKILPKRQFILMGPGRWGSRGDIKLGVSVSYSDISNTAMLVEIARQKGNYVPDLSFGTHFFQDLVESRIRYLPLYPDEEGIVFNERFLLRSHNLLPELLPDCADLADTVRVVDIAAAAEGKVLRVLMNADLDEAMGLLVTPGSRTVSLSDFSAEVGGHREEFWRWRLKTAEQVADAVDPDRFGVVAMYVFGSTKNATAGPGSDIDLLVHFRGDEAQRRDLEIWLEGWSLSLGGTNYLRTGYRSGGLLDVHIVTDEDIANQSSYAVKIGAITDPARKLVIGGKAEAEPDDGGSWDGG